MDVDRTTPVAGSPPGKVVELADRRVDVVRQLVLFPDGHTSSLTTREAQLLAYLAARPEEDVTREELLDRVWSYRASYATRAVDVTMRRLRAKIEAEPQSPIHLISVHGVGYRFVPRPREGARPASSEAVSIERADRSAFVGREGELAALAALIADHRLVSVLGPGGVGKSRLAGRFLADSEMSFAGGVEWCDLEIADGPAGVAAVVAATLGVIVTGSESEMVAAIGRALAGRGRTLVLLDAFERHVSAAADTVGRWLESCPNVVFLVTSRERLRLAGEHVVDVAPLAVADARALFVDRLGVAGVEVTEADHEVIERLVNRLDRLPLAIELAAPRARLMSLEDLHSRLDERFQLLSTTSGDGRTLRAVLDGSWDLLTDDERRALAWSSLFVGGFTLEAAEVVLDDGGATWPLDRVEALRDKSLLRVLEGTEQPCDPRLGLYDSVRDYAFERLTERGEVEAAEERHAAYLVALGSELALGIERKGGRDRMVRLAAEADNLLAVARRRRIRQPADTVQAVLALEPLYATRGPVAVLRRLLDDTIPLAGGDHVSLARLLIARGNVHRLAGETELGIRESLRALELVQRSGEAVETRAMAQLALLHSDATRLDEAEAWAHRGLVTARAGHHRALEGALLGMMAAFSMMRGAADEAEKRFLEATRVHGEIGNELRLSLDLGNFGLLLTELGRLEEAEERLLAALRLQTAWRNSRGTANAHNSLVLLRTRQGRMSDAQQHAREALRLYRWAGYTRFAALSAQNLALLDWATATAAAAVPGLRQVVSEFEEMGDRLNEGMSRIYHASALASTGDLAAALAETERARQNLAPLNNARAEGLVRVARGFLDLARARQEPEQAPRFVSSARQAQAEGLASPLFGVRFMGEILARELGP